MKVNGGEENYDCSADEATVFQITRVPFAGITQIRSVQGPPHTPVVFSAWLYQAPLASPIYYSARVSRMARLSEAPQYTLACRRQRKRPTSFAHRSPPLAAPVPPLTGQQGRIARERETMRERLEKGRCHSSSRHSLLIANYSQRQTEVQRRNVGKADPFFILVTLHGWQEESCQKLTLNQTLPLLSAAQHGNLLSIEDQRLFAASSSSRTPDEQKLLIR